MENRKIAIVHSNAAVTAIAMGLLRKERSWDIVDAYPSIASALPPMSAAPPSLLMVEFRGRGQSFMRWMKEIRGASPRTRVLLIAAPPASLPFPELAKAGISGCLLEQDLPSRLCLSITEIEAGGFPISSFAPTNLTRLASTGDGGTQLADLTDRERECLELLCSGLLYKEIASAMNVAYETVRSYLRNIYRKLNVRTRTEAVIKLMGRPT